MATPIESAWARLKKWYTENVPAKVFSFERGASAAEIANAGAHLGVTLPKEVADSYLICNGLHGCGLSYFGYFNSLKEMVSIWDRWCSFDKEALEWPHPWLEPDAGIKKIYWNRLRIPLTDNQDNNHVFLDLDPADGGVVGQVIFLERLEGPRMKLADSLALWLHRFVGGLESGQYIYDVDAESLIPKEQW